jgi:hypothetical protein
MIANTIRDTPAMAVLQRFIDEVAAAAARMREILIEGCPATEERRDLLLAALGHALDFET